MPSASAKQPRDFDAVLLDLFGTLVFVDPTRIARQKIGGRERPMTIRHASELLARMRPVVDLARFLDSLTSASNEIAEEKLRTNREIPSRQRFVRALSKLGLEGDTGAVAEEMSLRHMAGLAAAVVCPDDRVELLRRLGNRYRLALVSNFDHGPTARSILDREGLMPLLDVAVISDDAGVRKPGGEIFRRACDALDVEPSRCLHVGDSYDADVEGAADAGIDCVWIDGGPADPGRAVGKIADVRELTEWLDGAGRELSPPGAGRR